MYSTYDGAKRRAQTLAGLLRDVEIDIALCDCQFAIARAGGYRDWRHLHQTLAKGVERPAPLQGFLQRIVHAVPPVAVGPTYRWAESEISRLTVRDDRATFDREQLDWYRRTHEFVFAIAVTHRTRTPLLTPGSGAGMRLRQAMVDALCLAPPDARFDRQTYVLSFEGDYASRFGKLAQHRHFQREFDRLCAAGILDWRPDIQVLRLNPPELDLVRTHVDLCRQNDAEYWREAAR